MEEKSVFEQLLDPKDSSNIVIYDEANKPVEFEQIALIPVKENVYVILKPVKKMEGVGEDEGLVFELEEDEEGEENLILVDDEDIIDLVFAEYDKLLEE
ncbi:MAG: DUF1292 domain-containing protein [Clostridiales bacterium]|nr:DUF1292 domain-containing protein [Clostridiales bacterium]